MPVFEYRCNSCGETYELFHKGAEKKESVHCPKCQSNDHKKLVSAPAVSMAGSMANSGPSYSGGANGGCCGGGSCGLN